MSLYHVWATAMAPPEALIFRGSHLLVALLLVYLLYPLAVAPDTPGEYLNREFLRHSPNALAEFLPNDEQAQAGAGTQGGQRTEIGCRSRPGVRHGR